MTLIENVNILNVMKLNELETKMNNNITQIRQARQEINDQARLCIISKDNAKNMVI